MRIPRLIRAAVVTAALVLPITAAAPALADAPVPAGSTPDAPPAVATVPAGVDDFEFASFDAVYRLSRDDEGRSKLHTTENLVAVFPDIDQNRGIRRALVTNYQGHPTQIQILSVTDENGQNRDYETEVDGDFLLVTIAVPEGQYVHGEQHYIIEYTQKDVTAHFENTNDDEFYWDTNGTGWAQPFGTVSATVEVASDLVPALTDGQACYVGYEGSTTPCEITASGGTFAASVSDLTAYQNLTVVVAFQPGTFEPAKFELLAYVPLTGILGLGSSLLGVVLAFVLRGFVWRNKPGRGTIIAQYEPQDGVSALLAANIIGKPKRGMAASIVDLAVRRKLRIIERAQGATTTFGVQKLDDSELGPDEQRVMSALFGGAGAGFFSILQSSMFTGAQPLAPDTGDVGEVRWLIKGDTILGQQVVSLTKAIDAQALQTGLRRKPPGLPILLVGILVVVGFILCLISGTSGQTDIAITFGVLGTIAASWLGVGALIALGRHRPLTSAGSQMLEHLLGLREYIRLAEADRLQMLQSVSGADRLQGPDGAIIKIYERLLPYAVLFGLEKEWAAELAKYYDTTPPDWYDGNISGFHVAAFAASMGSLSSSVSTSYSGSSSSSSSGGSGGGGSSGGGGGGGGGGGV